MILKRIAKGIKDQDWFVVTIEVMIVVVGIFIGLQVDDWNEDRKEAQAEITVVERMLDEAKYGLTVIDAYLENNNLIIKRSLEFINKLDKKEACDLSDKEISDGLIAVTSFMPLDFDFMVLDELVQGGRVTLIADDNVRSGLARIRSNLALIKQQWVRYTIPKGKTATDTFMIAGVVLQSDKQFNLDNQSLDVMSFRTPDMLCGNYMVIGLMSAALAGNMAYRSYLERYQMALVEWQSTVSNYAVVINK